LYGFGLFCYQVRGLVLFVKSSALLFEKYFLHYFRKQNNFFVPAGSQVVLTGPTEEQARLENGRLELECPVCMEEMRPPRRSAAV
jgi:hypothetical protein